MNSKNDRWGMDMKYLNLGVLIIVVFIMVGCQYIEYGNNSIKINEQLNTTKYITNNWVIYENQGENYIILNTKTNEKITDVYDEGGQRFLSAQEAVNALNNK